MVNEVRHEPDRSRYELFVDGEMVGVADYRLGPGGVATFPHTVIVGHRRGQGPRRGAGAGSARRRAGRRPATVVPTCWYVAQFIDENPAYADLVAG